MKYTLLTFLLTAVLSTAATIAQTGAADAGTPNPRPSKPLASPTPQTKPGRIISNRPRKSTPAANSPSERYRKSVIDAIGARWYSYVQPQRESLTLGSARVEFHIDSQGHATGIKLVSNTSDDAFGNLCIQAVGEATLPALPPAVFASHKDSPLDYSINFTLYPLAPE